MYYNIHLYTAYILASFKEVQIIFNKNTIYMYRMYMREVAR